MIRYLLKTLLFSAVGSLAYFLVFYVTFPTEEMKARLVSEAAKADLVLAVGDIKPQGFSGLSVDGLSLATKEKVRAQTDPDDGGPPPVPHYPFLNLEELGIDLALMPLLRFSQEDREIDASVDGALYDGTLEGRFVVNQSHTAIDLKLHEVDLARYPFVTEDFQLDAVGRGELLVDMDWRPKEIRESAGTVSLDLKGFALAKSSKVMGFELPVPLVFRESLLAFQVEEGKANLTTCSFSGDAVTLEGEGDITLNKSLGRSRLNLKIRFRLGDELESFSAFLPARARSADGWFHYTVRGLLSSPRFREDTSAARAKGAATKKSPARATVPLDDGDDEFDDPEEDLPSRVRPMVDRARPQPVKKPPSARSVDADELEKRRDDRRQRAEEREVRRQERLEKIREQREQMRQQALDEGTEGELVPPFPGDEDAPFRPPFGVRDIPRPANVQQLDGDRDVQTEEDFIGDDGGEFPMEELPEPEIEIIEGDDGQDPYDGGGEFEDFIGE